MKQLYLISLTKKITWAYLIFTKLLLLYILFCFNVGRNSRIKTISCHDSIIGSHLPGVQLI